MKESPFDLVQAATVRTDDDAVDAILEEADDHFLTAEDHYHKALRADEVGKSSTRFYLKTIVEMLCGIACQNKAQHMWSMTEPEETAEKPPEEGMLS